MLGWVSLYLLVFLVVALGAGLWVGFALMASGVTVLALFRNMPVDLLLGQIVWNTTTTAELLALPMFILMGDILFNTKLSSSLFKGLAPWTTRLPGGLLHVNVLACTLFAAISGSSAATAATVGRITLTELEQRGYNRSLALGSLAGAGTLGFLIPPSIIMIIYGVLAEASILKLFIAGIIPGLMLAFSYMAYIGVRALLSPDAVPLEERTASWHDRFRGLLDLGPVAGLILCVIGSMYAGVASPSEAAALGVAGALIVAALDRTLTVQSIIQALLSTVRMTSMITLIVIGAIFLSVSMGFLGVPKALAETIASWGLDPIMLIVVLIVFYMLLGCILDGMSAIVMTLPVTLPLALDAGFDKIWFGVFIVIVVEMAQITPPVGFNLFVIQNLTEEKLGKIARDAFPFFLIMAAFVLLITFFPGIVSFLPGRAGY